MPIYVRVSRELGLVAISFEGVVTVQEFAADLSPLVAAPGISLLPLGLLDASAATEIDTPADLIRRSARHVSKTIDDEVEEGSKFAVVATRDEFFGLARMYEMLRNGSPVEVRVFRDLGSAEAWLGLPPGYQAKLQDVVQGPR